MRSKLLVAACALACGVMPGTPMAQVIEPLVPVPALPASPEAPPQPGQPAVIGKTVTDRARPEVDPLGLRFGEFFLFPRIELDEGYNDNIFATTSGKVSSWVTTLAPSFDLLSNFPQNELRISAGGAFGRYTGHSSEDYDDGFGSAGGRFDLSNLTHINLNLQANRLHEPRTAAEAPGAAAKPVKYTTESANLGISQTGTRIGYDAGVIVTRFDYESVPATGGGSIFQSDRDETGYEGALRVYYEFQPDYQAFIRGSGNTQQFDHAAGNGIPIRNSNGYRFDVGARVDLTGVTFAEFYVGYLQQDFQSALFGTIGGFDYGANVVWNVTTLDTVKFTAARTVNNANATIIGAAASPGYLSSVEGVSLDHELLRNVLLNANASYENDNWQNIGRIDHVIGVGAGAKWLMNRYLYLGGTWNFLRRNSNAPGVPYSQNIFLLRVSTQL
jgi:hypothetical protein